MVICFSLFVLRSLRLTLHLSVTLWQQAGMTTHVVTHGACNLIWLCELRTLASDGNRVATGSDAQFVRETTPLVI
jgi:hypothetical protein